MKIRLLTLAFLMAASWPAFADPIADRQAAMKNFSSISRQLNAYVRGQQPFDAAAVKTALEAFDSGVKAFDVDALFPAGTETGGGTEASPRIWEDRDAFKAAAAKFAGDVAGALAAAPQDAETLAPLFGTISSNCSACHREWRT